VGDVRPLPALPVQRRRNRQVRYPHWTENGVELLDEAT
jgi:hypothetical protein